jgi:predicted CXXCH cytochrome family protein
MSGLATIAGEVQLVMGHDRRERFLKPAAAYGKLELLSTDRWDRDAFGASCAGCHATGVDSQKQTFAALSLDCFVCHGEVPEQHTTDRSLVLLPKKRSEPARVVASVCGQCHLRGGKSKSSGRPYPNNFVAGDNLLRDFQVDLSEAAIDRANPADAHVLANVRDVTILGQERVTCLSCHDVHASSTLKHHRVAEGQICWHCHVPDKPKKVRKSYEVHSPLCGY